MRNLLFIILLLSLSLTARAQNNQSRIVDLDGKGIADVEVEGTSQCGFGTPLVSRLTVFTDSDGRFFWPAQVPNGTPQCSFSVSYNFRLRKDGYVFTRDLFAYDPGLVPGRHGYNDRLPIIHGTTMPLWPITSAASFGTRQVIVSEMLMAAFGENLALTTEIATLPLPTSLAGRKVIIRDVAGVEKLAGLLFVSPTQINFIVPPELPLGAAIIKLVDENNRLLKVGLAEITSHAPGIFTANADGRGVPAGLIVRVKPGNVQNYELLAQFDEQQRRFVPLPIDLGPEEEFLVLALFGTGWRHNTVFEPVRVTVGGINCPVEYLGKQPTFAGTDQINARLPRELVGKGEVDAVVSFRGPARYLGDSGYSPINTVKLNFK